MHYLHDKHPSAGPNQSKRGFQLKGKMTEPPFTPREKLYNKQKFFQSVHKHTYSTFYDWPWHLQYVSWSRKEGMINLSALGLARLMLED
ncbi:hypothetical protein SUGI_0862680 [Cryptomeria japonica]|nr:hypothetical protein SUGI_0862680 [Cryptomeria japonica]